MIKVLIVDDSATETALLKSLIDAEENFEVIACAKNGKEAVELNALLKPDLITMDIQMPIMNGYEAIKIIMRQHPTPIVVISSKVNDDLLNTTFMALEAGAISVLEKPHNISSPAFKNEKRKIIDTLRSMAEIRVVKHRFNTKIQKKIITHKLPAGGLSDFEVVAIGSSVGGPQALNSILMKLPIDFPLPIVIVQHMTQGFIKGFTKWLNANTELTIKNPENNEVLTKGYVYLAPDGHHLEIARSKQHLIAKLVKGKPVTGFCPSVTSLFQSVAKVCGKNAIGILLTGMGSDGAKGLLDLKHAHAHTIIQDEESAVVFGMAGVAQSLGAVDKVVELELMADYLVKITTHRK